MQSPFAHGEHGANKRHYWLHDLQGRAAWEADLAHLEFVRPRLTTKISANTKHIVCVSRFVPSTHAYFRGGMLPHLVAFWRLSRPIFLLGGIILYSLGAGIAHAQNSTIRSTSYVLGQVVVTSLQLMTHYLNEYWDVEADRLNESRTMFSGGSGILAAGLLRPETARTAATVCMVASVTATGLLAVLEDVNPLAWVLMLCMFLGGYFYSSPPLTLANSGMGELAASIVVAGLVPALGLAFSGGRFSLTFAFTIVPLVLLHFAMLLAFEFPDQLSDRTAGKQTLLVRIGRFHGALLHNCCLWAGIGLGVYGPLAAMPAQTVLGTAIVAPLAVWQMFAVAAVARGGVFRWDKSPLWPSPSLRLPRHHRPPCSGAFQLPKRQRAPTLCRRSMTHRILGILNIQPFSPDLPCLLRSWSVLIQFESCCLRPPFPKSPVNQAGVVNQRQREF
ncbi:MAG: prenyltransferase, partial [Planctomycetaceae bacterium]